jgi:hypothetical protein
VTVRRPGRRTNAARPFRAADGLTWTAEVRAPGASQVMVVFQHPDRTRTALDRYAWWANPGPEADDVTARLTPATVLGGLDDAALGELFRRSIPIAAPTPRFEPG